MITVGIPTFKRPSLLNNALVSVLANSGKISQVLIAITGDFRESVNRETRYLSKAMSLAMLKGTISSGFSGLMEAKQWIIDHSDNDIVLFLDDDAVLGHGYCDMVRHFEDKNVAAVSGSLITPYNDKGYTEWDDKPREFLEDEANVISYDSERKLLDLGKKYQVYLHSSPRLFSCQYLIGTALFVRKSEVVIDRNFQKGCAAGEELDFTYAMYRRGKKLLFDSSRVAWHLAGTTGGLQEFRACSHDLENFQYFANKWGIGEIIGLKTNTYEEKQCL
jgi:GT2 family glycosyltransferase